MTPTDRELEERLGEILDKYYAPIKLPDNNRSQLIKQLLSLNTEAIERECAKARIKDIEVVLKMIEKNVEPSNIHMALVTMHKGIRAKNQIKSLEGGLRE